MKVTENPIKKLVIVGGGTAGWIAASTIGNIFKNSDVEVVLVESEDIGIVGVGEATIPPLLATLESLGIELVDFIQNTQSTFKWGIRFDNWFKPGHSYFHPFGELGRSIDGHDFFQCWLKAQAEGDDTPLMAHSPEAVLSEYNKFFLPFEAQKTPLERSQFALHLDSALVGQYLRKFAEGIGVTRYEGIVDSIETDSKNFIKSVTLNSNCTIEGDFFIDCTGFKGLLIEKTLKAGYEDWSNYLPCNRAVTVQSVNSGNTAPFTIATARDAGWTWKIPLQHRIGNGYVFCDQYATDEEAIEALLASVDGELINEPRVIPFKTGLRKQPWKNNCLSLGLAQGFLEPLESTAIHLVSKTLAFFVRMFPDASCDQRLVDEFNRRVLLDYQEIRDFLVLHYCTTTRDDTEFWRWCKNMEVPDTLKRKIDFFKATGGLIPGVEELFQPTSWYSVFTGMGVKPEKYNPTVDALDFPLLQKSMKAGSEQIKQYVMKQPSHDEFLHKYCPAHKI